jgi:thiamine monophosphate synthase
VSLPRLLVVTDRTQAAGPLVEVVTAAVGYGARGVVLRDRDLPAPDRLDLVAELAPVLELAGGLLIVAGLPAWPAVHLAAREGFPSPRPGVVGRSCHSMSEVDGAVAEGCDYVTVSPVAASASKPGYGPALGPAGLAALLRPGLPVYALGGVLPSTVMSYVDAGAYGVAVMGPVMRDPTVVDAYLKELPS